VNQSKSNIKSDQHSFHHHPDPSQQVFTPHTLVPSFHLQMLQFFPHHVNRRPDLYNFLAANVQSYIFFLPSKMLEDPLELNGKGW
jgi:hypothetical protein